MTLDKKHKILYWVFKVGGVLVSCLFPMWTIFEKFPFWAERHGTGRSLGVGAIIALMVLAIIFRKSVFKFISDRLKLSHAPPLFAWFVLLIVSYVLIFIGNFLKDLTTVFWMGMIGCAIGTFLTFIGENFFRKKAEEKKNE